MVIALVNPLLEEVRIECILREDEMEIFCRGQPEGERQTFHVKLGQKDEFIAEGMSQRIVPHVRVMSKNYL